jgi:acyl transferase domain-containing protein/NAD(P)-dependent dehydrogenase (short-subunit alcohol dehydrogenase family)/pimeloyl-ACP methyl ester carboxylesterase
MNPQLIHYLQAISAGNLSVDKGLEKVKAVIAGEAEYQVKYFAPEWRPDSGESGVGARSRGETVAVYNGDAETIAGLAAHPDLTANTLITINPGAAFTKVDGHSFTLNPADEGDFHALLRVLSDDGTRVDRILLFWRQTGIFSDNFESDLTAGFYAVHGFAKALMAAGQRQQCKMTMFYHDCHDRINHPGYAPLGGYARALYRENPYLTGSVVEIDRQSDWLACIENELKIVSNHFEVKYQKNQRYIKQYRIIPEEALGGSGVAIKENGVYLISGGTGKLGFLLAEYLLGIVPKVNLVLLGSSILSGEKQSKVEALRQLGTVIYIPVDLSQYYSVERAVSAASRRFGKIDGMIHCAGTVRDALILNKKPEDIAAVLTPKIRGAIYLDKAAMGEQLDFFVLYSSIAAVIGSPGQSDYSFANAFLNYFAEWRNALSAQKLRYGKTVSVGWPFWKEGGMQAGPEAVSALAQLGIGALENAQGMAAFQKSLAVSGSNLIVIPALNHFRESCLSEIPVKMAVPGTNTATGERGGDEVVRKFAEAYLRNLLAEEIRLEPHQIKLTDPLEKFGLDSMMAMTLVRKLEKEFGQLPKTLFYEYLDLEGVIQYFCLNHPQQLLKMMASPVAAGPRVAAAASNRPRVPGKTVSQTGKGDVAVIGLAGRYPMAENVAALWEVLKNGQDCITEVPAERWDMERFFDPQKGKPGKSYSKWGGFLQDADQFDAFFFHITPAEAELLDPQARLFLQTAWHTMEDAGYTPEKLSAGRTGVYVGVMYSEYQLYSAANSMRAEGPMYSASPSYIANRVSYFMNLKGPSLAVDTMCSSSITAILLACRSILSGECELALAGGVNLSLHPYKYQLLSQGRFAAEDGRCKSFGAGGTGYVPGEGVGAVLLKPLAQAERDGDHIYGVIKGGAINHGGKTNGFTVPNPLAQEEVIREALRTSGVPAETITYIETHGTGTSLGDPIEIAGLVKAFEKAIGDSGRYARFHCPIGSIKSNIGHLESAAGIAALTKVLLQMKHQMLVPSIHAQTLNPNIDFRTIPFEVQRSLEKWENCGGRGDEGGPVAPRRAGISSFGAGGSNAHLIVEEYPQMPSPGGRLTPNIFVLTALDRERLAEYARKMLEFISGRPAGKPDRDGQAKRLRKITADIMRIMAFFGEPALDNAPEAGAGRLPAGSDRPYLAKICRLLNEKYRVNLSETEIEKLQTPQAIAARIEDSLQTNEAQPQDLANGVTGLFYTLQTGRRHFEERMAVIAQDIPDLTEKLRAYCAGISNRSVLGGRVADEPPTADSQRIGALVHAGDFAALAQLWINGANIDWKLLYDELPLKCPLPGYPFGRDSFWPAREDAFIFPNGARGNDVQVVAETGRQEPVASRELTDIQYQAQLERELQRIAAAIIKAAPERLKPTAILTDFGFESVTLVEFAGALNARFNLELEPTIFYERISLRSLAGYLYENYRGGIVPLFHPGLSRLPQGREKDLMPRRIENFKAQNGAIAIIGMAGIFPGSADLDAFWENLKNQRDLISIVPDNRWNWRDYVQSDADGNENSALKWGGFIEDIDKFDARFFEIAPGEAEMMDPQQRKLLENVWHTIEDAGYKASQLHGKRVGLFIGTQFHDYQGLLTAEDVLNPHAGLGNEPSILVNRVSFYLNLKGPSEPYNTACSSSLVAVHRAIQSIGCGESEVAIAGGVSLMISPWTTLSGNALGALSPEGRCKTLDAAANGYVRGEGVATVMLKPLEKAVADHDNIYAVIKSSGINHGGKAQSLTAPNSEAQAELLAEVYGKAGIKPETISYIELHGTGTKLGDPVEIQGLKKAFQKMSGTETLAEGYCGLGTVKTNIGHLEPVAGMAGLIKLVLACKYKTLPGILHLKQMNPYIQLDQSPFYVVKETQPWKRRVSPNGSELPLLGGVSSFGFGGVNAHIAVEEYEPGFRVKAEEQVGLLVLSAKDKKSLVNYARLLNGFGEGVLGGKAFADNFIDLIYTLQVGREEMAHRLCFTAATFVEMVDKTKKFIDGIPDDSIFYNVCPEMALEQMAQLQIEGERLVPTGDLEKLARHWVGGGTVDWEKLYPGALPYRISLPLYPFERIRYWKPEPAASQKPEIKAAKVASATNGLATSSDDVLQELTAVFRKELKTDEPFGLDTNFGELGMESIISSVITQKIRERFGNVVSMSVLTRHPTFRELTAYLETIIAESQTAANSIQRWPDEILPLNMKGAQSPSFWVHGGPGYGAFYQSLAGYLGDDYPFYAFQAKGVDGRKIPQTFEEMVEHYKSCIQLIQKEGPYIIGGYSFGGLVAYEIARRLNREGKEIGQLFIFDTLPSTQEALDRFYPYYGGNDNLVTVMMGNEFAGARLAGKALISPKDIEDLPAPLRVARVVRLAKERGRNIAMSEDDMYGYINACTRISGHLTELTYSIYRPEAYDGSPVTYFKARCFLSADNVIYPIEKDHDPFVGYDYVGEWAKICRNGFRVVDVPVSDHLNLIQEPALSITGAEIRNLIDGMRKHGDGSAASRG